MWDITISGNANTLEILVNRMVKASGIEIEIKLVLRKNELLSIVARLIGIVIDCKLGQRENALLQLR